MKMSTELKHLFYLCVCVCVCVGGGVGNETVLYSD